MVFGQYANYLGWIATVDILINLSMEIENLEVQKSAASAGHADRPEIFSETYGKDLGASYDQYSTDAETADYE